MTRNFWKRNNYVFDLDSKAEVRKLAANDGVVDGFFGIGVAISGNVILVAANGNGVMLGTSSTCQVLNCSKNSW